MFVRQGHTYAGGASVPFFVSSSMIRSGAQSKGFDQVGVYARKSYGGPMPPVPPGSSNDWDTLVLGRRAAPDGNVDVPAGVRWVVDTTPVQQPPVPAPVPAPVPGPAPAPAPAPAPPIVQAGWDWPAIPTPQSVPSASSGGWGLPLLVGIGVVGGAFLGWEGFKHMFVEGLTAHERKNILLYTASVMAAWGASELFNIDEAWWLTPQGVAARAAAELR